MCPKQAPAVSRQACYTKLAETCTVLLAKPAECGCGSLVRRAMPVVLACCVMLKLFNSLFVQVHFVAR